MQTQQLQQRAELPEWQARLRERLLTKKGEGAEAILSELSAEEALTALRDTLLPEVQSQGKALVVRNLTFVLLACSALTANFIRSFLKDFFPHLVTPTLYLAMAAVIGGLFFLWLSTLVQSNRLARLWNRIYGMLPRQLPAVQYTTGLSALIDLLPMLDTLGIPMSASGSASETADAHMQLKRAAQKNMLRLLSHLSDTEARGLTENNRQVLLRLAQNAETEVDLGIAALLTLGTMGEPRVRPVAQKLTTSFLPRVREAAKECLQSM